MKNKGQAAMEFLITYGWAILVVLAAVGALAYFGVLSPVKLLPDEYCTEHPERAMTEPGICECVKMSERLYRLYVDTDPADLFNRCDGLRKYGYECSLDAVLEKGHIDFHLDTLRKNKIQMWIDFDYMELPRTCLEAKKKEAE